MSRYLLGLALLCGGLSPLRADDAAVAEQRLLDRARQEAPGEVQLHIVKTTGRMADFAAKVRKVERVPGWPQVRAEGEAAYSAWDNHKRDFAWRSEKFEVLWDVSDRGDLKLNAVTLGGISRKADS